MRIRTALLVAATTAMAVASLTLSPLPAPAAEAAVERSATADRWFVDTMLFRVSMSYFLANVGVDRWFDWSTDLCSAPLVGSTGRSFDFRHPCRRHDFGYRNLRLIDRRYGTHQWNATSRKAIDDRFLRDMLNHCETRSTWLRTTCRWWAQTFYAAVRVFGGP